MGLEILYNKNIEQKANKSRTDVLKYIDKNKRLEYYNFCKRQKDRAKRFKRCANSFLLDSINQIHTTALSHCRSEISLEFILHIFRKKVKFQAFLLYISNFTIK